MQCDLTAPLTTVVAADIPTAHGLGTDNIAQQC